MPWQGGAPAGRIRIRTVLAARQRKGPLPRTSLPQLQAPASMCLRHARQSLSEERRNEQLHLFHRQVWQQEEPKLLCADLDLTRQRRPKTGHTQAAAGGCCGPCRGHRTLEEAQAVGLAQKQNSYLEESRRDGKR